MKEINNKLAKEEIENKDLKVELELTEEQLKKINECHKKELERHQKI